LFFSVVLYLPYFLPPDIRPCICGILPPSEIMLLHVLLSFYRPSPYGSVTMRYFSYLVGLFFPLFPQLIFSSRRGTKQLSFLLGLSPGHPFMRLRIFPLLLFFCTFSTNPDFSFYKILPPQQEGSPLFTSALHSSEDSP